MDIDRAKKRKAKMDARIREFERKQQEAKDNEHRIKKTVMVDSPEQFEQFKDWQRKQKLAEEANQLLPSGSRSKVTHLAQNFSSQINLQTPQITNQATNLFTKSNQKQLQQSNPKQQQHQTRGRSANVRSNQGSPAKPSNKDVEME